MCHGPAHPNVGEERVAPVHVPTDVAEPPLRAPGLVSDLAKPGRLRLLGKLLSAESNEVHLLLLERQQRHVRVWYDPEHDAFKLRPFALVAVPPLQHELLILHPFHQAVRATADRIAVERGKQIAAPQIRVRLLALLENVLRQDREEHVPP